MNQKICALINGRYNDDGSVVKGEIRISENGVTVMMPCAHDYFGITKKKAHKTYPLADVEAALQHDGWASLGEIENSGKLTAAEWLAERVRTKNEN